MKATIQNKQIISPELCEKLLKVLESRFKENMARHKNISWNNVEIKLRHATHKLWSLSEMERTMGDPDVIGFDGSANEYIFCDCSPESPAGRRSTCYDLEALNSRKANKPKDSAVNIAEEMGIEILTEDQYRELQKLGSFDAKTSSWLKTPSEIRKLGGAIFGDRRYNTVFVFHNGADSYYSARGFRGMLRV